jgi:hypothetical protein
MYEVRSRSVHSQVLRGLSQEGEVELDDAGVKPTYISTTKWKKVCTLSFNIFK